MSELWDKKARGWSEKGMVREEGSHPRQESHPLPGVSHPEDDRAMSKIRNLSHFSWRWNLSHCFRDGPRKGGQRGVFKDR